MHPAPLVTASRPDHLASRINILPYLDYHTPLTNTTPSSMSPTPVHVAIIACRSDDNHGEETLQSMRFPHPSDQYYPFLYVTHTRTRSDHCLSL